MGEEYRYRRPLEGSLPEPPRNSSRALIGKISQNLTEEGVRKVTNLCNQGRKSDKKQRAVRPRKTY